MYTLNKLRNELFLDDEITRVELEKKLARSPSGARSKHSNVRPFLGLQMEWKAARGQRNFTIVSLAIGSRGSRRTRLIAISSSHLRAARPGKSRLARRTWAINAYPRTIRRVQDYKPPGTIRGGIGSLAWARKRPANVERNLSNGDIYHPPLSRPGLNRAILFSIPSPSNRPNVILFRALVHLPFRKKRRLFNNRIRNG